MLASALLALAAPSRAAEPVLIGMGHLSDSLSDRSGSNYSLESGLAAHLLGGLGVRLAWAGDNTFLALPDRGPNAKNWGRRNWTIRRPSLPTFTRCHPASPPTAQVPTCPAR